MEKVFIYGTLRRGFCNHEYVWGRIGFLGLCSTTKPYPLVIGARWRSPYLLDEPGQGHRVKGDLFEADEEAFEIMDRLESVGKPKGYLRQKIMVTPDSGRDIEAWAYLKRRQDVEGDVSDPVAEYQADPEYVTPMARKKA